MLNKKTAEKISFWNLVQSSKIEIPIIQRDYAQGRIEQEKVRKRFGSFYLDNVITPSGVASRVMDNIVAKNSDNPYEKGSDRHEAYADMYSRISHVQQGRLYQVELAPSEDEYLDLLGSIARKNPNHRSFQPVHGVVAIAAI